MSVIYAEIAVDNAAFSFDNLYSYSVPEELSASIQPGCRVLVPFGNSKSPRMGIVVSLSDKKPEGRRIKSVRELIDPVPMLNDEMLSLAKWMSDRYFCTVFDAVKAMLPCGVHYKMKTRYMSLITEDFPPELSGDERSILEYLSLKSQYTDREKILSHFGISNESNILEKLCDKGLLSRNYEAERKVGDLKIRMAKLSDDFERDYAFLSYTQKQKNVISLLQDVVTASVREICCFCGVTPAVIKALENKGALSLYDKEILRTPVKFSGENREEISLSQSQSKAFSDIMNIYNSSSGAKAVLLYGVTGSGKTKVYIKVIDQVIKDKKTVILMVPEISLTPQTIRIFRERYGDKIAVFHSALSMGERVDEYKRVKNGEAEIVIGTRSAVFAPFENPGLIIIDEEQEHTYKSESNPRYHAREVAKFRCAENGALLLLSSATPSVETFARAKEGKYHMVKLPERYGNALLPKVTTVNLCDERNGGEKSFISSHLFSEIKKNLDAGEQSIILLNRRGYNTFVACSKCGNVVSCPNCSISMTYHALSNKLMCHYCGYTTKMVEICSNCSSDNIRYSGVGTQKIESDLKELFPKARILRMDADTTVSKSAFEENFKSFSQGEYDIMVGTQMVSKGLDFENVTLVGVVLADQQLYSDDYRSTERTFSLLTQVVGRAGRGNKEGRAVIQTYTPDNETIRFAVEQDYEKFFDCEIKIRKMMVYPPYCDLCVIGFQGREEIKTKSAAHKFLGDLKEVLSGKKDEIKLIVLGPVPLKVAKVSNKYRYRLILKCRYTREFREILSQLLKDFDRNSLYSDIAVYTDINPENMI